MKSFRTDKDTENSPYAAYQAGPSCRVRIIGPAWLKLFFATMKAYGYYIKDTLVSLMDLKTTSNFKLKKILLKLLFLPSWFTWGSKQVSEVAAAGPNFLFGEWYRNASLPLSLPSHVRIIWFYYFVFLFLMK